MDKLYRIVVLHAGPQSQHTSTETYLVAESDEDVAEWIDLNYQDGEWFGSDLDDEPKMRRTDENEEIPFRAWVMRYRGDLDDYEGWEDLYYGVKRWGWQEVAASADEISAVLSIGIARKLWKETSHEH